MTCRFSSLRCQCCIFQGFSSRRPYVPYLLIMKSGLFWPFFSCLLIVTLSVCKLSGQCETHPTNLMLCRSINIKKLKLIWKKEITDKLQDLVCKMEEMTPLKYSAKNLELLLTHSELFPVILQEIILKLKLLLYHLNYLFLSKGEYKKLQL